MKGRELAGGLHYAAFAAVMTAHVAFALAVFDPAPFMGGDNAVYLALARSLLRDGTYRDLFDPALPFHTQYPPVFPAILAIAMALGVQQWIRLKLVIVAFGAAAVGLSYLWVRRRQGPWAALMVALVIGLGPNVAQRMSYILSDVPFWAMVMLALWAFEELPEHSRGRFAIAVAATVAAYMTRSAGVPLAVAVTLWLLLHRRKRQTAVFLLALGIPVIAWHAWGYLHPAAGGYGKYLFYINPYEPQRGVIGPLGLVERMWENLGIYTGQYIPRLVFGSSTRPLKLVSAAIFTFGFIGWLRRMRRPAVADLFAPLYMTLLLVWPRVWADERFLLPVLPIGLAYAVEVLGDTLKLRLPRYAVPVGALATVALLWAGLQERTTMIHRGERCRQLVREQGIFGCATGGVSEFGHMALWSRRGLPAGAAVISRKPSLFWIFSGHPSRIFPFSTDPDTFFAAAREAGARFVLYDALDSTMSAYVGPAIVERPEAFCVVDVPGGGSMRLLGIVTPGASAPPPPAPATEDGEALVAMRRCGPAEGIRDTSE